jgi:DNA-binding IscR family transcriptional regulator
MGVKGPSGGYALAQEAAAIRVGDVVRAVEGPIAAVDCVLPGQEYLCQRADRCVTHLVWLRLSVTMAEFLDSVTLADLCDQASNLVLEEQQPDAVRNSDSLPQGAGTSPLPRLCR